MKTLYLLRHAKSSWDDPDLDDRERPLNERGQRAAPAMAYHMKTRGYRPDLVLCSPATRCVQTLEALAENLGELSVRYDEALYLATPGILHGFVTDLDPGLDQVLIIAHNPGIGEFARMMADPGDDHYAEMAGKFPTAGLAVLTSPANAWTDLGATPWRIAEFVTPKMLT